MAKMFLMDNGNFQGVPPEKLMQHHAIFISSCYGCLHGSSSGWVGKIVQETAQYCQASLYSYDSLRVLFFSSGAGGYNHLWLMSSKTFMLIHFSFFTDTPKQATGLRDLLRAPRECAGRQSRFDNTSEQAEANALC